jgi:hypothetical protein
VASLGDRLDRLESRRARPASPVPGMSEELRLFLKLMNNERAEIDRADREALGSEAGKDASDFGGGLPESEPLTLEEQAMLANEPRYEGESAYLDLLIDLRTTAGEDVSSTKLKALDKAILHERKLLKGAPHEEGEESG